MRDVKKRKGRLVFIALFLMVNLYAILSGGLYFFQENLLFHPTQLSQDYTFKFDSSFEEITHTTSDGAHLHGLYFKVNKPKGTLLYFHGNAGDLSRWGEIVQYFVKKDYNVVVMDYRNFGKSMGIMSERALYEDADWWYAFAKAESLKTATSLYIYGRSLGTTFATYVASKNETTQLILETPFYSVEDEAISRFPILPVKKLLKYRFPTNEYINEVQAPITIIHGTEDMVVAYEHGKKLYDHIKSENKLFVTVPGGGHNDLINYEEYREVVYQILGSNSL